MSATALLPRDHDAARDRRPGLLTLTRIELRKACDTRAGFWLLLACVLLVVAVAAISIFAGHDSDHTLGNVFNNSSQVLNVLLPVVGILLVTSEWSQRTAQVTFTLVPHRGRVLAAKLLASIALALLAFVVALVVSLLFTAINASSGDGAWSLGAALLGQSAVFFVLSMLIGAAFGAAFQLSAPAIVASFVLTIAYAALTAILGLDGLAAWTNQGDTFGALTDHSMSAREWARVGTTLLLWLVVPLAVGAWRFLRGEIR
jgi:ABC-2 type transport system permease protein